MLSNRNIGVFLILCFSFFSNQTFASQNPEPDQFRLGLPPDPAFIESNTPPLLLAQSSNPGFNSRPTSATQQTREWEARTLRSLATGELFFGGFMMLGALAALSDAPLGALLLGAVGGLYTYYGYTNLTAAQRFFSPQPLLSDSDETEKEGPVVAVSYTVNF